MLASVALLGAMVFGTAGQASAATIIYVKASASGLNNGTSWANAYKSLQVALAHAASGQQIWVAKGIYKPTARPVFPSDPRGAAFSLKNGVAIYGGFAGTETLLSQRNWVGNVTFLSGDIGTAGVYSDDAYDVVFGNSVNSTAILDGFRIVGGYANCGCWPGDAGGGMFLEGSSPTLRNLIFSNNYASGYGGGLTDSASSPSLSNVTFSNNRADNVGGGMYNASGSKPALTNVVFSNNKASFGGSGGGMYNDASSPKLTKVTFSGNAADNNGGGMLNTNASSPSLTGVTFSNNTAVNGAGMHNDSSTPKLTNVTFSSNTATTNGGGIDNTNSSNPNLSIATFSHNSAGGSGGGIYNDGAMILGGATFTGNTASNYGGGMFNNSGSPILVDSTFAGNSAVAGGGIFSAANNPGLINTTFSGNAASANGGALFIFAGSPIVYNSIFWGDSPQEILSAPGLALNYSILKDAGCPGTCSNVSHLDPKLGPLQNNGGYTQTMALGAGSAALDAGNMPTCAARDQRGVVRPQGGACDMGAYEVRAMTFVSQAAYDGQVLESATVNNGGGAVDSTSGVFHVGDNSADRRWRGFLSFNTAALPDAATVVMATARVRQSTVTVGNPFVTLGPLVADLATPYFGTGIGLASPDWQASATVTSAGTWLPDGNSFWTPLNAAGMAHINKLGTTQIRMRFTFRDTNLLADYITLYSGEATTVSNRPTLTVYYNP